MLKMHEFGGGGVLIKHFRLKPEDFNRFSPLRRFSEAPPTVRHRYVGLRLLFRGETEHLDLPAVTRPQISGPFTR